MCVTLCLREDGVRACGNPKRRVVRVSTKSNGANIWKEDCEVSWLEDCFLATKRSDKFGVAAASLDWCRRIARCRYML